MTKVFFISFPFDAPNSGDYDYCQKIVSEINKFGDGKTSAEYLTGTHLGFGGRAGQALSDKLPKSKNKGGKAFYEELEKYYSDDQRITMVTQLKSYITSSDAKNKVLNLQLRPPETGFVFSPKDLEDLRKQDIKVCITTHEYKLNYDRKWMQSILHPYFEQADLVWFFNRKDLSNANKHATHSVFLERVFSGNQSENHNPQALLHAFSAQSSSAANLNQKAILVTKQELTELKCEMFVGELRYEKGAPIRYSESGSKTKANPPVVLEWGIRNNLEIATQGGAKFVVSGIIFEPKMEVKSIELYKPQDYSFAFHHKPYDLAQKSKLTKVPATTAEYGKLSFSQNKEPNIVIFGLIREGKGYEDAIDVITEASSRRELSKTRLIMVGSPVSLKLLAEIINKKFDCGSTVTAGDLKEIHSAGQQTQQVVQKIISKITEQKLFALIKEITKIGFYSEGIEQQVYKQKLHSSSETSLVTKVKIANPTPLQQFVTVLAKHIPESLPIDIFLDIPQNELEQIFARVKYAVKYDEKGWANNASGLINLLSYGCILYTSWGMCTDEEVTDGKYKGAIVLPKGKYCLKPGEHLAPSEQGEEKRQHFKSTSSKKLSIDEKKQLITAKAIVDDIIARESNHTTDYEGYHSDYLISNGNNQATFGASQALLKEFDPVKIVGDLIVDLSGLFPEM